ncbi:DegQ family serine endoprotease [Thalassotalea agarivorans]|uniref:Peptidase Do. Serine peptidase. MEROPS family S01B n=1 Tax=Thalassotalea agarivorans TaxID=349064 RepID=A0A1I0FRV7_THASX|nr:DegQ family serine endoprotease [Thalassotalea agarivorans]SET60932.1 peptidase Do . Serine peptidase. MEROPS family S01B [Thalassotalea agarivorans]
MKKIAVFVSAALLTSTASLAPLPASASLPTEIFNQSMPSLAPMLEKTTPAVVSIAVRGTQEVQSRVPEIFRFFGQQEQGPRERPFQGLGSGVIIDAKEGYIVTNAHVVDQADEIQVTLKDGRQFDAKKIGQDKDSDIALLQIDANELTAIKVADSDALRVGDFTVAIGNPFGLGQTVTSGIVSALGRSGLNIENYENFIQTDAAINSGNSGGALVNLRGELIGINTAILAPSGGNVGIGFAIPSNMMNNLVSQLIEYGEVNRGRLGVSGYSVNSDVAKAMELDTNQGGFIQEVEQGSAAEDAGIQAGDVIIKVNGKSVKTFEEIRGKIGSLGAGKKVQLTVVRDGDEKSFTVTLKKAQGDDIAAERIHPIFQGVELENQSSGILVKEIAQNSPARRAGLQVGDVIRGVNRTETDNIAQLKSFFEDNDGMAVLNVNRDGRNLFVRIQ